MFEKWRFLELTAPIREVLATEEALTDSVHEGPVLLISRSKPHSISIPANKDHAEINKDICTLLGADWSRRSTSGETVYHNHLTDFSYSMIVPAIVSKDEAQAEVLDYVRSALRYLGVPAEVKGNEIIVDGKKISSSSSIVFKSSDGNPKAFLIHGYLLYEIPSFLTGYQMIKSSRAIERRARESLENHTAIKEYVNMSFSDVVNAFLETMNCSKMFLKNHEIKRVESILENKYNNDNWQLNGHIYS